MPKRDDRHKIKSFKVQKASKVKSVNALKQEMEDRRKRDEIETSKVYDEYLTAFIKDSTNNLSSQTHNETPILTLESPSYSSKNDRKKSNLELFKEELEKEHVTRKLYEDMAKGNPEKVEVSLYSSSGPDCLSSCIYVGNLPNTISEAEIVSIFLPYGPIGTIKLTKSQKHEEFKHDKCCAFVTFMCHFDSELAYKSLNENQPTSFKINVGWAKPSPFPLIPAYLSENYKNLDKSLSKLPFNAQPHGSINKFSNSIIFVRFPKDWPLMQLIHRFCEFVIREGPMFEAMLMNREMHNPSFRFLFDPFLPEHAYYRWKLFSILQGDNQYQWREAQFQMFKDGPIWVPPQMPPASSNIKKQPECTASNSAKPKSSSNEGDDDLKALSTSSTILTKKQILFFHSLLRHVSLERKSIAEVMVWSLDHSDSAEQIADILTESLCLPLTPIPNKIARLYCINDILYNSSADKQNAASFRRFFEKSLLQIFSHLHDTIKICESKINLEKIKKCVISCLNAWNSWLIYAPTFIQHLHDSFLDIPKNIVLTQDDIDGVPMTNQEIKFINVEKDIDKRQSSSDSEDIDGIPMDAEEIESLLK